MVEHKQMMYVTIHREYYDKLVSWCRHYISNDPELVDYVEDWVQEAFYRALKDRKFPAHSNKYGWFLVACMHLADNAMQRKGVRHKHISIHLDAPEALPFADIMARVDGWMDKEELLALLEEIVKTLTPTEIEIYQDVLVAEGKAEAVATQKGKSVDAIKATICRIRKKARKIRDTKKFNLFFLLMVSFYFLCS